MKKFAFAIAFMLSVLAFTGCAAPKLTPQELSYSETVSVQGMGKDELFARISQWSSDTFRGPGGVPFIVPELSRITFVNPEQGFIGANHTNIILDKRDFVTFYILVYSKVTTTVIDGQYRIMFEVTGVQHTFNSENSGSPWTNSSLYEPSMVGAGIYKDVNSLNLTKAAWGQLAASLRYAVSGMVVGN